MRSAVNLFMINENGNMFRVAIQYDPYFYVKTLPGTEERVAQFILSFNQPHEDPLVEEVTIEEKEDLDLVYILFYYLLLVF